VTLSPTAVRHVLSDWDFDSPTTRANVIRITAHGVQPAPAIALAEPG